MCAPKSHLFCHDTYKRMQPLSFMISSHVCVFFCLLSVSLFVLDFRHSVKWIQIVSKRRTDNKTEWKDQYEIKRNRQKRKAEKTNTQPANHLPTLCTGGVSEFWATEKATKIKNNLFLSFSQHLYVRFVENKHVIFALPSAVLHWYSSRFWVYVYYCLIVRRSEY